VRILHAIHDFLPRHRAGSEIYAFELCRALEADHHVTVLCADFDPTRPHGHVAWRACEGLPVAEIVNNWRCASFEETYRSPVMLDRIAHVMRAVQPDVLHVHSLLNLSFDLPALARSQGVPVVATLHDYTLMCASGGQRVHRAEQHLCEEIDAVRCARCFGESALSDQMSLGRLAGATAAPELLGRAALTVRRRYPAIARGIQRIRKATSRPSVGPSEIEGRLAAARHVFDDVDLFVAPSQFTASEFERLGIAAAKIRVSDYGFAPQASTVRSPRQGPLRLGYVGTLVWHKGVHVLVDAVRALPPGEVELRIFGGLDVFPEYVGDLRARASGLPIRFEGAFDRADLAAAYAEIDVLVVPSLWLENSPLVIHEAFAAGIPVVAARIGGIVDLVRDGENGVLYEAASTAALSNALRGLIAQPERVAYMSDRVRTARPVKTIAEDAREWTATYSELVAGRSSALRS
jgi:glycosyltransferase involved in cell wall biosynthesis